MKESYSDKYVFLPPDPRAEPYFQGLPGAIQDQIRALDHYPATFQELLDAVDRARKMV